jgi:hypothetical protein
LSGSKNHFEGPINTKLKAETRKQMTNCSFLGVFFNNIGQKMVARKYGKEARRKQYPISVSLMPYSLNLIAKNGVKKEMLYIPIAQARRAKVAS